MINMGNPQWKIRVTPELDHKLDMVAEIMGIGKTEVIRFASAQFAGSMLSSMEKVESIFKTAMDEEVMQKYIDSMK